MTIQNQPITILCAALKMPDGKVLLGYRHVDIWENISYYNMYIGEDITKVKQGFITSDNKFVNRKEAYLIAYEAGQIEESKKSNQLTSEDLY